MALLLDAAGRDPTVMVTSPLMEELPLEECRRLLAGRCLGRLGVIVDGKPFIFPVNYAFQADTVVFRTGPGTKLAGSAFGPTVFEIDGLDEGGRGGWSVIVHGVSTEINGSLDTLSESLQKLELQPWAPGEHGHWVALRAESVTGRRVTPGGRSPGPGTHTAASAEPDRPFGSTDTALLEADST